MKTKYMFADPAIQLTADLEGAVQSRRRLSEKEGNPCAITTVYSNANRKVSVSYLDSYMLTGGMGRTSCISGRVERLQVGREDGIRDLRRRRLDGNIKLTDVTTRNSRIAIHHSGASIWFCSEYELLESVEG